MAGELFPPLSHKTDFITALHTYDGTAPPLYWDQTPEQQEGNGMETIFVNLDARRITVCGNEAGRKACVGQEAVCYPVLPRRKSARPEGKVLDFEACRRALGGEPLPEQELPPVEEAPEPRRRKDLLLAADLIASAGVLAAGIAVAARFFLGGAGRRPSRITGRAWVFARSIQRQTAAPAPAQTQNSAQKYRVRGG